MMPRLTFSRRVVGLCTLFAGAATCVLALVAGIARADGAADWPTLALPPGTASYSISPRMAVDGIPMKLEGFESPKSPAELVSWFRAQLPQPLLENTVGTKLVLGHPHGSYFFTIQMEAVDGGTKGVVAVTDIDGAMVERKAGDSVTDRVLAGFPAGTQVVRSMTSSEQSRSSTFVALVNRYSEDVNRQRLVDLLLADGMRLEREATADAATEARLPSGTQVGSTLFFKGEGKEATAVITRGADSQVNVVLNTVTNLEQFK
jgi:hypothetical protein